MLLVSSLFLSLLGYEITEFVFLKNIELWTWLISYWSRLEIWFKGLVHPFIDGIFLLKVWGDDNISLSPNYINIYFAAFYLSPLSVGKEGSYTKSFYRSCLLL